MDVNITAAQLVLGGYTRAEAEAIAPQVNASAGSPGVPAPVADAAGDPSNAAALDAAAAGGETSPDAKRFLAMSTEQLAELPLPEFKRGFAAAKKAGLL